MNVNKCRASIVMLLTIIFACLQTLGGVLLFPSQIQAAKIGPNSILDIANNDQDIYISRTISGDTFAHLGGVAVGDVNGDGIDDFIASALTADVSRNEYTYLPGDQDEWTEENTLPLWNVKFNGTSPVADPNHVAGNYSISSTRTGSGSVAFQLQFPENLDIDPSNASLHFQVYAEDINEKLSLIRIHAPDWDNRFRYSPSLTLSDEGWTQVDLNISDFFSEDGSPDWNNIDLITLSFFGGSQGDIRIDKFYFENATPWQSPGIPANLTAAAGSGEVVLSWDTVENANSYNLYLSRHPGITRANYRNNLLGMKLTNVETPYRLTGLNNDTTYYFIVTAENSLGESLSSNEVSATPITNSVSPLSFEDISMTAKIETTKKQAFGNPLWGDINNDGYLDIIDPHHDRAPALYLNNGDETFKNIISESGIPDKDYKFDQHGFALGDYNNDGNLDIFIAVNKTNIQLWEGDGTGKFFDVTNEAGIESSSARTANWVDYDNDGNLDLFIRWETNGLLYKNDGYGHFIDVTDIAGLRIIEPRYQFVSSFADFDNDGDMDLFVGGNIDTLYANNGDGTFSLNESFAGKKRWGSCRGIAWGDYNNDGFIDLYVSRGTNDYYKAMFWDQERITFSFIKFTDPGELVFRCECNEITFDLSKFGPIGIPPSYIFIGEERRNPGEVPFTLSSTELTGIPEFIPGEESGFFVWKEETDDIWHIQWTKTRKGLGPGFWGHIESDGDFIDVTTNLYPTLNTNFKNTLYRNNGDGTFTDVTRESRTGHIGNNSGVTWGDFDNDGYLDLYVVDAGDILGNRTNTLYRNLGDGTFEDITSTAGVDALDAVGRHYGAALGDFNNDGTLDLLLSNGFGWGYPLSFGNSVLYKNLGNNNNWINLKLAGTESNRSGIGARVILNTSNGIQTRQLNGIGGELYSQGLAPLHFGLGDAEVIDSIMVIWPGGIVQTLNQIPANQELTIIEVDQDEGTGGGDEGGDTGDEDGDGKTGSEGGETTGSDEGGDTTGGGGICFITTAIAGR